MELRRTPLYDEHVALGGRIVPFAGWELPVQYSGLIPEHTKVRTALGLFDVSHMGELRVRGGGAVAAVNKLVTNDVASLVDGQAQYNGLTNERGGLVDDVVVYRIAADDVLVCVNAANRDKDRAWFEAHLDTSDCSLVDEGDAWAQIAFQGPSAERALAPITDVAVAGLANYRFGLGSVAGVAGCIVARTGYTGEDGFEVFCPAEHAVAVWRALLAAGEGAGAVPCGLGARDTLRLEARYNLYGHELSDETSPWQAGLAWITKLDKAGGFVGQDALRARRGNEATRLVGVRIEGKRIPRDGMRVFANGADVGVVTSGTLAPTLGYPVALAYVHRDHAAAGAPLVVDVRGKEAPGVVVNGPFYKRGHPA